MLSRNSVSVSRNLIIAVATPRRLATRNYNKDHRYIASGRDAFWPFSARQDAFHNPQYQEQQRRGFSHTPIAKMHENEAKLYPNPQTAQKVLDYSIAKSTALPDWLVKYHQWGVEHTKVPSYLTSTYQAQMLVFLAKIVGAKKVLELGVYIGFSGMFWSHAVGRDGKVVGLELSEEFAGIARQGFQDNGVDNVDVKVGDAIESLKALEPSEPFDLIFLDANKDAYPQYLEIIMAKSKPDSPNRLLKQGGLIVADNVLRRAIVADATPSNPNYTRDVELHGEERSKTFVKALHEFNENLVNEPRLETFLMPLFDGLGMARLLD